MRRTGKEALFTQIAVVAQAVANPHRLELLDLLVQGPRSVEQLAEASAQSVANASQHLQRLKRAGLVVGERRGTTIRYRLADLAVARLWVELRTAALRQHAEVELPAGAPVVTICAAGRTSLSAAEQLRARGLEAHSLEGGMRAWSLAWNTAEVSVAGSSATVLQVRRTGKGCLSYLVGADGVAAVIDPSLDPTVYLELARQRSWRIAYVLETHLHADHLSRARQLAEQAGAALALPAAHRVATPFMPLHDGDTIALGAARLTVRETPGHTPESVTYQLDDTALFTGDTLFLAAVGRPDLHADPEGARMKAHALYASLQRLLTLPTETLVLPGHTSTPVAFDHTPIVATLAEVRRATPLLAADEHTFVSTILSRIPPTPPNHAQIIALNEQGAALPADPAALEAGANRCAIA